MRRRRFLASDARPLGCALALSCKVFAKLKCSRKQTRALGGILGGRAGGRSGRTWLGHRCSHIGRTNPTSSALALWCYLAARLDFDGRMADVLYLSSTCCAPHSSASAGVGECWPSGAGDGNYNNGENHSCIHNKAIQCSRAVEGCALAYGRSSPAGNPVRPFGLASDFNESQTARPARFVAVPPSPLMMLEISPTNRPESGPN